MSENRELLYELALSLVSGIGGKQGRKLLQKCGSAEAVFREKKGHLIRIGGVGIQVIREIRGKASLTRAERELEFIGRNRIHTLFISSERYPKKLRSCPDAPLMLYFKGDTSWIGKRALAIVGTRRPSNYGKEMTEKLIHGLNPQDVAIISGLAYGIDTQAHRAALEIGMDTVGVLAHGLDLLYPSQNRGLAGKMIGQGGLLTEFPSGTKLNKDLFPRRNRIIAGLSDALVLVESDVKGGGMITARIASSYNRDVFAIPGLVPGKNSAGPHLLIKTNIAALVESAEDIKYNMGWDDAERRPAVQKQLFAELSEDQQVIMSVIMEKREVLLDDLICETEMPPSKISGLLLDLEFKGLISLVPGGRYRLA
jgi:DNA processing protein